MRVKTRPLLVSILLLATLFFYFLSDFGQEAAGRVEKEERLPEGGGVENEESLPGEKNAGEKEERRLPEKIGGGARARVKDKIVGPMTREFRIVTPFNFPQPTFSLPTHILLRSRWVRDLQAYLRTAREKTISVVTSTMEHTDVLLNWLIAANVKIAEPLQNVLVISMDAKLHSILVSRGVDSLYVNKDMVVSPTADVPRVFSQVHVVRLAVVRLMNHYGYDVINYDCDAIPLRNPQPIFDQYSDIDLIGTFGKGPNDLYVKWGVALNTGVMLMRATSNMEQLWKEMPFGKIPPITDDQNSINFCLDHMGLEWTNYAKSEKIEDRSEIILGRVPLKKKLRKDDTKYLTVMLMPYTIVCRHVCDPTQRDNYYVWHALAIRNNRTVTNKRRQAMVGGAWHLEGNWREISEQYPDLEGTEWLRRIATQ